MGKQLAGKPVWVWALAAVAGLALAYLFLRRRGTGTTATGDLGAAGLPSVPDQQSTAAPVLGGTPDGSTVGYGVSPDVLGNVIGDLAVANMQLGLGALGLAATAEQQVGQMGVGALSLAANAQTQLGGIAAAAIDKLTTAPAPPPVVYSVPTPSSGGVGQAGGGGGVRSYTAPATPVGQAPSHYSDNLQVATQRYTSGKLERIGV